MSNDFRRNIGHSEASSSISTIIKAVLAIEKGIIPPTAGIDNLSANGTYDYRPGQCRD